MTALLVIGAHPFAGLLAAAAAGVCAWLANQENAASGGFAATVQPAQEAGLPALAPLLEAMPEPALLVNLEGRVVGSNIAARRALKFEAERPFLSAVLRQHALLEAVQAAQGGQTRTVEYETTDQVDQHIRCYVAPIQWGADRAVLLVFHDQTARINTERMRADFLANASHELRTPLASLTLLIETLGGHARDNAEERGRFLAMMQVQAERMRRLIDDLLSLSRIELDEHIPPSDRADLALVAREVIESARPLAAEKGVRLSLIGGEGAHLVVGERFQLAQVVQNLVDNAVKYAPPDGEVRIELGAITGRDEAVARAGRRWEEAGRVSLLSPAPSANKPYTFVRVEDSGPGVARRHLPRLGERFFRVEREEGNERGGTGLGLAIVKHIINRHRGGFVVESEPGRGSAFAVYLERAGEPG